MPPPSPSAKPTPSVPPTPIKPGARLISTLRDTSKEPFKRIQGPQKGATLTSSKKVPATGIAENRLVVGWDFGTTFCCVGFSLHECVKDAKTGQILSSTAVEQRVNVVRFESGQANEGERVVETVAYVDGKGEMWVGAEARGRVGRGGVEDRDEMGEERGLLRYLKLGICGDEVVERVIADEPGGEGSKVLQEHIDAIKAQCSNTNTKTNTPSPFESPSSLLSEFIHILWTTTIRKQIIQTYIAKYPSIATTKLDLILTRSALWSFAEDHLYTQAFENALQDEHHLSNIAVMSEPHAALVGLGAEHILNTPQLGTTIVVLDMGGGTVDVTSVYVASTSPLELRDVAGVRARALGCGFTMITAHFKGEIGGLLKITHDATARSWDKWDKSVWPTLEREFERAVRKYKGCEEGQMGLMGMHLTVPKLVAIKSMQRVLEDKGYTCNNGNLEMTHRKAQELIEKCLSPIVEMTVRQVKETEARMHGGRVRRVMVVGGMSANVFVRGELERRLGKHVDCMNIVFPEKFQKSAIAKGAALHGASRWLVDKRELQVNIGFEADIPWTGGILKRPPAPYHTRPDPHRGNRFFISNAVRWLFTKGKTVKHYGRADFTGTRCLRDSPSGKLLFQETLYCSPAKTGAGWTHGGATYHPLQEPGSKVIEFGQIEFEIEDPLDYAWSELKARDSRGVSFFLVQYQIGLRWNGARLEWHLRIPKTGHFDCAAVGCAGRTDPKRCVCVGPEDEEVRERGFFHAGAMFGDERVHSHDVDMADLSL